MEKREQIHSSEPEPEPEPKATDLRIIQKPWATVGIFKEYPEDLLEKIAQRSKDFHQTEYDKVEGARDKFFLEIPLDNETSVKLYIKRKVPVSRESYQEFYLGDIQHAKNYEKYVEELGGQDIADLLDDTPESLLKEARSYRYLRSALNEVLINLRAAFRYKKEYGQELPIEKPVGFVIERNGERWAIFEFIDGVIDTGSLPENLQQKINDRGIEFARMMTERLQLLGIEPGDLEKGITNLAATGDPDKPDSLKFTIIDTEEWMPLKTNKKSDG